MVVSQKNMVTGDTQKLGEMALDRNFHFSTTHQKI